MTGEEKNLEARKKEWAEKKSTLLLLSIIIQGYTFDGTGLVTNPGKYQNCTLAAVYYGILADSGEGEHMDVQGESQLYVCFEPTPLERVALGLNNAEYCPRYCSYANSDGFVFGKPLSPLEWEKLQEMAHSDNPDDELVGSGPAL